MQGQATPSSRGNPADKLASLKGATNTAPFLERYEIITQLGQGGMGVVYEVFDKRRERRVAMKVLKDPERGSLYRFKREFRAAAHLLHPNLVRLFDLGTLPDASLFFTMELLRGQSLSALASTLRGPQPAHLAETLLSPNDLLAASHDAFADTIYPSEPSASVAEQGPTSASLLRVIAGILEGLRFLHATRKVHRDLKPANVMIDAHGEAKLLDFGIIRELDNPNQETITQGIIGTPVYMSPEQISSKEITPAADIYSFGCLLYELLAGAPPFTGGTARVMAQHLTEEPAPPSQRRACDPTLERLCLAALQKAPQARPSAEELLSRLHSQANGPKPRELNRNLKQSPGLLGRTKELQHLAESRDNTKQSRLLLLSGESGSGKSALCAEFALHSQQERYTVWFGRCYEREQVPYKALDAIVDAIAVTLSKKKADALRLMPLGAASLLRVFPVLREAVDLQEHPSEATLRDVKAERLRAIRALFFLLRNLSGERPPLLVIEDLHWADTESIEALSWLLNASDAPACFVLANYRPEEVTTGHPLQPLLHAHHTESLRLAPLSEEALLSLVDAYSTASLQRENKRRIIEEANRNPLLVVELSRVFREDTQQLPRLSDVVEQRLQHVSQEARQLLELSAVAGSKISFQLLAEISGLALAVVSESIDELLRTELLRESPGHEHEAAGLAQAYDLAHDKLRQASYESISAEQRRRLHAQLAAYLEEQDDALRAVEHWRLADEPARAKDSALAAAKRAELQLAFGRAAVLYGLASQGERSSALKVSRAEALSKAGLRKQAAEAFEEAAACEDADLRGVKLRAAAEHIAAGQFQLGIRTFQTLLVPYRLPIKRPQWRRLLMIACYAVLAILRWSWFDVRSRLGKKLRYLEPSTETEFQLRLFLTIHQSMFAFDPLTATEFGLRFGSLAYRRRSMSHLGTARLIHGRSLIAALGSRFSRRGFRHVQIGESLCAETNNTMGLLDAQLAKALIHTFEGNSVAAKNVSDRCEELARRGGLYGSPLLMLVRDLVVGADYFSGDFRSVLSRAESYLAEAKESGTIIECVQPLLMKGLAHLVLNEVAASKACFQEANAICAKTPLMLVQHRLELMQTELLLYEGKHEEGLRALDEIEAKRKRSGVFPSNIESSFASLQRWRFLLSQEQPTHWRRAGYWRLYSLASSAPITLRASAFRIVAALYARQKNPRMALRRLEDALFLSEQNSNDVGAALCYAARAAVKRRFALPGADLDQEVADTIFTRCGTPDCYFFRAEGWHLL